MWLTSSAGTTPVWPLSTPRRSPGPRSPLVVRTPLPLARVDHAGRRADRTFASIDRARLDEQVGPDANERTTVDGESVPSTVGTNKDGEQITTDVLLPFDVDGGLAYWGIEILLDAFRDQSEEEYDVEAASSCKEVVGSVALAVTESVEENEDTAFFDEQTRRATAPSRWVGGQSQAVSPRTSGCGRTPARRRGRPGRSRDRPRGGG